jgi:hypothetical protein
MTTRPTCLGGLAASMQILSAPEVAAIFGKTVANVYVIANRNQWRRLRHDGRIYYNAREVAATFGDDA